jgi:hypothetical protein
LSAPIVDFVQQGYISLASALSLVPNITVGGVTYDYLEDLVENAPASFVSSVTAALPSLVAGGELSGSTATNLVEGLVANGNISSQTGSQLLAQIAKA